MPQIPKIIFPTASQITGLDEKARAMDSVFRPGVYEFEYYTASQVAVYIGDVFIDEIVKIGFNYTFQKTPLWGFRSKEWDTVALGRKIVQGQIVINYKEEAYLQLVLRKVHAGKVAISTDEKTHDSVDRRNIEQLVRDSIGQSGAASYSKSLQILETLWGVMDTDDPSDAEQVMETLENTIWQKGGLSSGERGLDSGSVTTPPDLIVPSQVDIYIAYGDYERQKANHTSKKISDVHLTGTSQTIQIDGMPVFEVYPFIARGLDI